MLQKKDYESIDNKSERSNTDKNVKCVLSPKHVATFSNLRSAVDQSTNDSVIVDDKKVYETTP